jgi:hypothetical protein
MWKSGSTLAFELCKSVLEHQGFFQRHLPDEVVLPGRRINFMTDLSTAALERALAEVKPREIIVVKVHTPVDAQQASFIESAIRANRMKVVVNVRDPRDICLSLVDAGRKAREKKRAAFAEIVTLADASAAVRKQLSACRTWGAIAGALHLSYDELAFDSRSAVAKICDYFGIPHLTDEDVSTIMTALRKDTFTQLNKGIQNRHKSELSEEQNEQLLDSIDGARPFIAHVIERRDYDWFQA